MAINVVPWRIYTHLHTFTCSWPAHSEENRELLGTEEESTDRSDDEAEEVSV